VEPLLTPTLVEELDLAELWRSLVSGKMVLTETAYRDGRCFGVLSICHPGRPRLRESERESLERVLTGAPIKVAAADVGVSLAAICVRSANALRAIATPSPVSRTSMLLVMAALAAQGLALSPALLETRADGVRIASVELPGSELTERLSPAEVDVLRLVMEGKTHLEMAAERSTSQRTIANQMGAIFRKFRSSGRTALRVRLIEEQSRLFRGRSRSGTFRVASLVELAVPA